MQGLPYGLDVYLDLKYKFDATLETVLDVGAHRGETISAIRQVFPDAAVLAFEPVSDNFSALQHRFGNTPHLRLFQAALGAASGRAEILLQADSQTHSLRHLRSGRAEHFEEVVIRTLDDVVESESIDAIDLLKVDTEGFELEVIQGGRQVLRQGVVRKIVCEASLDANDTAHSQLVTLQQSLAEFGFILAGIYDQVCWTDPVRLAYFNALFVRS